MANYGNELVINLSNGKKLVCAKYEGSNSFPEELSIYIADENGEIIQDICLVRESFKTEIFDDGWLPNQDKVDVLVWADKDDEDYSNKFLVEQISWKGEEEND